MWITSICSFLSVGYRGQHDRNSQVANKYPTFRLGIRDLGIHDVGYSRSWVFCTVTLIKC